MRPEFKIYRNLHKDCFSVMKWNSDKRGYRLHSHEKNLIALQVEFKVSQWGRKKVLESKQKNVHAFVCCQNYITFVEPVVLGQEVYYNPYKMGSFMIKNSNESIHGAARIAMTGNKCYLYEKDN
jgi:hypothetical protein